MKRDSGRQSSWRGGIHDWVGALKAVMAGATAVQMVAVLTLILHDAYYMDFGFYAGVVDMNAVGLTLLYLSVVFTITSAGEYVALLIDAVEAKDRRLAERGEE